MGWCFGLVSAVYWLCFIVKRSFNVFLWSSTNFFSIGSEMTIPPNSKSEYRKNSSLDIHS